MIQPLRAVIVVVILVAGVPRSSAQPSPVTPSAQAALDEASQLTRMVEKLHGEGKFRDAVPLAERALALREKALGPTHPDLAENLNDLGVLYQTQGAYAKAESLLVRALAIHEKALGPTHPKVARSLDNLAMLYPEQGVYAKAEPLFVRALDIREKALGPAHPDVATSLNNIGLLYQNQGAYAKAEPLLVHALNIREKALGPTHRDVANSLNNLATLYQAQGAYAKAEPLYVRSLVICEKALGPTHPHVATSVNNLATLYQAQGAYAKAEPLFVRLLTIKEKALGPTHPTVATSLNNLAGLYQDQGAYAKAEPLFVRSLAIREKVLGSTHPDVAQSLNNLGRLYQAQGAYAKAEPLFARAAEIQEQQLHTELARLSEPRKRALMTLLQKTTNGLVSLHADVIPNSTLALKLALTTVLRRKGRILDSLIDNEARVRSHLTPRLRDQLDQLSQARSELVARLYAPAGRRSATDRDAVPAIRVRIEDLESALSEASDDFRTQVESVTVAKVQAALPASAALVEFVRYHRFDPRQPKPLQEARYVAYLLTARGPPQWVALGEATPIDAEVDAVLTAMDSQVAPGTTKAALQRLDARVFAPIRARLPGVSHVILAPDGKLNLVPFEALVDPQGHYALEQFLVSYVTTGRDLLRFARPQTPRSPAVIMADPDYGPLPSPRVAGAVSFAPLAGATAEATDLRRYFPTAPVTGGRATKAALAALTGPACSTSLPMVSTPGIPAQRRRVLLGPRRAVPHAPSSWTTAVPGRCRRRPRIRPTASIGQVWRWPVPTRAPAAS